MMRTIKAATSNNKSKGRVVIMQQYLFRSFPLVLCHCYHTVGFMFEGSRPWKRRLDAASTISSPAPTPMRQKSTSSSHLNIYFRANEGLVEEEDFYSSSSSISDEIADTLIEEEEEEIVEINNSDKGKSPASEKVLDLRQAEALQKLVSTFPYAYEDVNDFCHLSPEQSDALQGLLWSFASTGTTKHANTINKEESWLQSSFESNAGNWEEEVEEEEAATNTNTSPASDEKVLSPKQKQALESIKDGRNIFVTGVAGTGKSLVLHKALEYFQDRYGSYSKQFVAVAPTGPTALALGGQTIHSFAGIGIPKSQDSFAKTRTNKENAKRWKNLQVLVLDECSMISGEFMDRLSREVSIIRKDPRPFGGIQLVLCGDFLQLPPITPNESTAKQEQLAMEERGKDPNDLFLNQGFCFQSHCWKQANFETVELDVVFRQKNQAYVDMLREIRNGRVTNDVLDFLENCKRPLPPNEYGIRPTLLHSRNKDVSRENMQELDKLPGRVTTYDADDTVDLERGARPWVRKALQNNPFFKTCIAEKELQLKLGAEVVLVKNLPASRLVNGSRGKVVNFRRMASRSDKKKAVIDETEYPVVQFVNGVRKTMGPELFESRLLGLGTCKRRAVPLKLAWAITTHKAQGLTLDYVVADVGGVFGEAQTYVALSRATDQNGLELRNFSGNKVRSNPVALSFYRDPSQNFPTWDGGRFDGGTSSGSSRDWEKTDTVANNNDAQADNEGQHQKQGPTDDFGEASIEAIILGQHTVPELKEMLKARGLKTTGRKADLVQRLRRGSD